MVAFVVRDAAPCGCQPTARRCISHAARERSTPSPSRSQSPRNTQSVLQRPTSTGHPPTTASGADTCLGVSRTWCRYPPRSQSHLVAVVVVKFVSAVVSCHRQRAEREVCQPSCPCSAFFLGSCCSFFWKSFTVGAFTASCGSKLYTLVCPSMDLRKSSVWFPCI